MRNLPFVSEPPECLCGSGVVRDLQRNDLAILLVRAFREKHRSHSAAADLLDDAIRTDPAANP
jgi:hypothetical protein